MKTAFWAFAAGLLALPSATGEKWETADLPTPMEVSAIEDRVDYGWRIRPLDSEPIELHAYRGKVLLINAWASWCTPCVRELASIERLASALEDTDVAFLMVAVERESSVRNHLRRYPLDLPIFLEEERFPAGFGLRGIPMTWIVDREGRIVFRHFGAGEWDAPAIEKFVRELAG